MRKISTNILLVGERNFNVHQDVLTAFAKKGVDLNVIKMTREETEDKNTFNVIIKDVVCVFMEDNYEWFDKHKELIRRNIPIVVVVFKNDHDELYYRYGATAVISTMAWSWYFDEIEHIIDVCLYNATYNYCKNNDIPIYIYTFKNTRYNPRTRIITVCGTEYKMTKWEAYLWEYFCLRKNEIIPVKDILKYGWYFSNRSIRRAFDVHITHIRKYLKDDETINIETVGHLGFRLNYNPNEKTNQ